MRYIGAKTEIVSKIHDLLIEKGLTSPELVFCDAFSGTAAVGDYFKDKYRLIANDIQYYSYVITSAKLNSPDGHFKDLGLDPFTYFNDETQGAKGFISQNYAPKYSGRMYFSDQNAARIDFIRQTIETWHQNRQISDDEYFYLIGCLIESVSKVANVAGVYGAYLKIWDPRAVKPLKFIGVESSQSKPLARAKIYNQPIDDLLAHVAGDILYLDPPYTATQYSGQYHLLETIAKYDDPIIKGKGGLRNTSQTASTWARKSEVEVAFERTIKNAKFKHIILSYSTDGLMSEKYIESVLKRHGRPGTYKLVRIPYKKYINYHSTKDATKHCELLFYVEKRPEATVNYASPMNYQGGKYDIVDFIKANLPPEIETFIDVFGGGYNVGVNVPARKHIYNEYNDKVAELIDSFYQSDTAGYIKYVRRLINKYHLEKGNSAAYQRLRADYNKVSEVARNPKMLFTMLTFGFHQQLRFNTAHDFNNPVGNSSFNDNILEKLVSFSRQIKTQNLTILNFDFADTLKYAKKGSFFYCDPPYLITLGSYNDGKRGYNGWGQADDARLYDFLDQLDQKACKFMLSNVLEHKGRENIGLKDWIKKHNYVIIEYRGKGARGRKEIIVKNY